jgi:hypothetical protein
MKKASARLGEKRFERPPDSIEFDREKGGTNNKKEAGRLPASLFSVHDLYRYPLNYMPSGWGPK